MSVNELARLFEESQKSSEYQLERAIVDFTEDVCQIMEDKGISRADLARRLGKSRAWVTKLLRGDRNLTLKTIVDVLWELGYKGTVAVEPEWNSLDVWDQKLGEYESQEVVTVYTTSGQRTSAGSEYIEQAVEEPTETKNVIAA